MKWFKLILLFVVFGFASCEYKQSLSPLFLEIDSLLDVHPDSALIFLENGMQDIESMTSAQQAEYALLLTQAFDKNYIPYSSDSIIKIAVDYYNNRDNIALKGRSYYYLGRVYQDLGDDATAVEAFLNALDVIGEDQKSKLHIYININLALCYANQGLYSRAMERYQKAYQIGNKLDGKEGLFFSLREMGNIYLFLNKPDSALNYYMEAYTVAEEVNDSLLAATALCDIAHFYNDREKYEEANIYISRSISVAPQNDELAGYYFLKGNVLSNLHQYDSAHYYLVKSLGSANLYTNAASNYALYKIEKQNENYKNATEYADRYIVCYDSIQIKNQREEITKLMNDYALESHKKEVTARQQRLLLYWVIGFLVILSLCVYGFFLVDRRKKAKLIGLQQDLMQNRSKLLQLQNVLAKSTSKMEQERHDNEQIQQMLQEKQRELCMRLFETTSSYKMIQDFMIFRKQKKEPREISDADRKRIQNSIDEIYIDFIQRQQLASPLLSGGDLYCCTLAYMGFSNMLIAYLMGVDSNVVTQRRYRIKGKMDETDFNQIFSSSLPTK